MNKEKIRFIASIVVDFSLIALVLIAIVLLVTRLDLIVGGSPKDYTPTVHVSDFCNEGLTYTTNEPKDCQTGLEWLQRGRLNVVQSSNIEQANNTTNLIQRAYGPLQGSL